MFIIPNNIMYSQLVKSDSNYGTIASHTVIMALLHYTTCFCLHIYIMFFQNIVILEKSLPMPNLSVA